MSGDEVQEPRERTGRAGRRQPAAAHRLARAACVLLTLLPLILLLLPLPTSGQPAQPPNVTLAPPSRSATARVLLLYSEPRMTPAIVKADEGIRQTLRAIGHPEEPSPDLSLASQVGIRTRRSGSPALIAGYLGRSDAFDKAIGDFAVGYADQNERDGDPLRKAALDGRIKIQVEA